ILIRSEDSVMLCASCLCRQAVPAFVLQTSAWYSIVDPCGRHAHFVYKFNSAYGPYSRFSFPMRTDDAHPRTGDRLSWNIGFVPPVERNLRKARSSRRSVLSAATAASILGLMDKSGLR